jgi:hypothetical protein
MLQAMRPLARRKSSGLGLIAKLHARIVEIVGPAAELPENGGALPLGCADALGSTGQSWCRRLRRKTTAQFAGGCSATLWTDFLDGQCGRNPRILWLPLKLMELVYSIQAQFLNRVAQGRTTDRSGFSRSVYPPSAAIWARGQRSAAHVGVASPMTIARVPVTVALIYKGHVSNVFHLGFQMMF